jgi:hypothetical protein
MKFCPLCVLRQVLDPESDLDASALEPTRELASRRFQHYELVIGEDGKPIELGRGAMGVTYKAFDVDLRVPVTLKLISERYLGDESARLHFLREARAERQPFYAVRKRTMTDYLELVLTKWSDSNSWCRSKFM